ncbi:glycoside hydrolase family 3, partial [Micromonospora tulbaghiae]
MSISPRRSAVALAALTALLVSGCSDGPDRPRPAPTSPAPPSAAPAPSESPAADPGARAAARV